MNYTLTISELKDKGYRLTKARKEIVKIFSESKKPLTASEVKKKLIQSGQSVNKTTIYRELKFLDEKKYLKKVYIDPSEVSYESSDLKHHHHLVCEECGKIFVITDCLVNDLEKNIRKKKGFIVRRHNLEFYGICKDCSN
ncbi:transcriptional repressor [Candidatus Woesebacteria bacterium]|nr:transcriptional repressor [Candidatus Woesebacteria bacterium]